MTLAASALNATTLRKLVLPSTKARFSGSHRRVVDAMRRLANGRPTLVGRLIGSLTTLPTTVTKLSFIPRSSTSSRSGTPRRLGHEASTESPNRARLPRSAVDDETERARHVENRPTSRRSAVRPSPESGVLQTLPRLAVPVEHDPDRLDELVGRD